MKAERERERRLVSREFETQRGLSGIFFSFFFAAQSLAVFIFYFL